MPNPQLTRRLFWSAEIVLLVAMVGASVWLSSSEEWQPLALVVLLLGLALVGQWFTVETTSGVLSASLVAIVLAMGLLGPVPAAACGILAAILHSAIGRRSPALWLNNFAAFGLVAFAGGLMIRELAGSPSDPHNQGTTHGILFGLIVLGVFMITLALNFVLVAWDVRIEDGPTVRRQVRDLFLPLLPGQLAAGMLATVLAVAYRSVGLPMLFGAIAVLLILQYLTVALLRSEDRAEQLEARSIQLASMQFGVLAMLMDALALRDPTAGRHAAAVARYAKALAIEVGASEADQDLIHTAGLLHDIGKFTWSDRVLHPESLSEEDWVVIRRHPQDGAMLVGKLDGYGPVADAILYHHERPDGGGYPAGLIGNEIPLASRIVAICSTYDTMTARDAYRTPMSSHEAVAELRRIAGRQLDAELVESFIGLLEREGPAFAANPDFEAELAFDRRVQDLAAPSVR